MPLTRTLCLISLFGFASLVNASSLMATTDALVNALASTSGAVSDASASLADNKVLLDAKDDAASFVASQGLLRGAQLQAAFEHLRATHPQLQADDLQLANAILAY
jgi:uncharacterized protein (TIGR02448 family)